MRSVNLKPNTHCRNCEKPMYREPASLSVSKYVTCSRKCRSEFVRNRRKRCEGCGGQIPEANTYRSRFCSKKCSGAALRTGLFVSCKWCGKEFYTTHQQAHGKPHQFCSRACSNANKVGKHSPGWVKKDYINPYPLTFNRAFKVVIRERDCYSCAICGGYGKHVHHIDYNKDNTRTENCITVCLRCHNSTNFNRDAWRTFFLSGDNYNI